jgi:di/tricarboxylate transporter
MAPNGVPGRNVHTAIAWPVILPLGALLPVAGAVAETKLAGVPAGDYWRLGLPLEPTVIAVSVPLLPLVWPV